MKTTVKCPNCSSIVPVDEILITQFRESVKKDLEAELLKEKKRMMEEAEESRKVIKEQVDEEYYLKLKDREKLIEDLKVKLEEAKRRADQGSMQLQGEVQEMSILELLREAYPSDMITQTKKGVNGGDILQQIRSEKGAECGSIYYESKRTKTWSNEWVHKLKEDNLNTKADVLVIVTSALPKDMKRYGIIDGVWVCTFADVRELSLVLRYGLIKLQEVAVTLHGKETKMELLYNYLTSDDFRSLFESILSGFETMRESHQSEKLRVQRMWKEREQTLEKVLMSSINFYESIRKIAGSAIPHIKTLEGPSSAE